jgi:transposase-like protein
VTTDRAAAYPRMLDELLLSATRHITEQYANNPIETDQNAWNPDYGGCTGLK